MNVSLLHFFDKFPKNVPLVVSAAAPNAAYWQRMPSSTQWMTASTLNKFEQVRVGWTTESCTFPYPMNAGGKNNFLNI